VNVSTAVANSSAPELATSLAGHVRAAAVGAMPSAAAVCVSVAAAMPVAIKTALQLESKQRRRRNQKAEVPVGALVVSGVHSVTEAFRQGLTTVCKHSGYSIACMQGARWPPA
jgi:hypothetical protein